MLYNIDTYKIKDIEIKCTISALEQIFTVFNVTLNSLENLFRVEDTVNIKQRVIKIIEILQIDKSTPIQLDTETEYIQAVETVTECIYNSLPKLNDIPKIKHTEHKKENKNKTEITIPYVTYIAVTILGLNIKDVANMTVRQIMILYGQHLLYNIGAEDVNDINDMIPM